MNEILFKYKHGYQSTILCEMMDLESERVNHICMRLIAMFLTICKYCATITESSHGDEELFQ